MVNMRKVLICVLCLVSCVLCLGDALRAEGGDYIDLNKVSMPEEFGTIKEVHKTPLLYNKDAKMIFHIQDVHANYEAQKNLANILEYLIMTYGVNLILVEGGITDKEILFKRF